MEFRHRLRNRLDWAIRQRLRWELPGLPSPRRIEADAAGTPDVRQWVEGFPWRQVLTGSDTLEVADVGARTFCYGPLWEEILTQAGARAVLHGIEVDAYRRFGDFRTRHEYARQHLRRMCQGRYHAMDFLHWRQPLDGIFLLSPFVTLPPLLAWGLPGRLLRPEALFAHCARLLRPREGWLLLSCPTRREYRKATALALRAGFQRRAENHWFPSATSVLKSPRYGCLLG